MRLDNFTGPFDLLLQLIGKHKLDVTEVALHQVTDDFIAYIRAMGDDWDLGEASEFLLVAATLLDLKAARLLPAAEVEDEEDLALLEARDLLFARLLQYKAYKEARPHIWPILRGPARGGGRARSRMEPRYAEALPDLVLGIGAERLFKLALKQFTPKPGPPEVSIAHIHQMRVSVREHAEPAAGQAATGRVGDVHAARRRLREHPRGGGPVPGAAGAVSRGPGGVRAAGVAGRADRAVGRR